MDLIDKFNNKINNNSFDLDLLNDTINDLQTNPDVCTLTKYENSEENVITIQESKPDEQLTKFIKYLYDTNKMDSNYKKKDIESKKISEMNYEDILTKLTFIIRGDRFCSGNLYSYVKNGEFLELLLRLRNLIMEEVFR